MNKVFSYFRKQAAEVSQSRALSLYGVALGFSHVFTLLYWLTRGQLTLLVIGAAPRICWPMLPDCQLWPQFPVWLLYVISGGYLFLALATIYFFLQRKSTAGCVLLALATLLKLSVFLQDYRMMGNYNYIGFLVSGIFLLIPAKEKLLPLLLCLFYFFAGTIKFKPDWLEGAALVSPSFVPPEMLKVLLPYAIVLEMVFVWGLLARRSWLFWAVFVQFVAFHFFSWHIVGFFYPITMLLLLSLFPLQRHFGSAPGNWADFFRLRWPVSVYAALLFFTLAQVPSWLFSPDAAVTGEGRLFAVNMLDARAECDHFAFARYEGKTVEVSDTQNSLSIRIRCDPIVYWNLARAACRELSNRKGFRDLDVFLVSRRHTTADTGREVMAVRNFCATQPRYSWWARNSWVGSQEQPGRNSRIYAPDLPSSSSSAIRYNYREGPPARWQPGWRPREQWRIPNVNIGIHTASKASPAVDSTGIYVGGDSSRFFAFDLAGRELWRFDVGGALRGIHSTASLDEDGVYFGAYNGRFYKLRKKDGSLLWATQLGEAIGASPLLSGDSLYVNVETDRPDNGFLAKLDRTSGKMIWKSLPHGEQSHSTPVLDAKNGILLFGANNGKFFALDDKTGALRWNAETGGPIKSTPLLSGEAVYFTSWDGFLYALESATGKLRWRAALGAKSQSSPTLVPHSDILVLGTSGNEVLGISANDGRIRWRLATGEQSIMGSALGIDKGKTGSALIACGEKQLCELGAKGERLRTIELEGKLDGVPVAQGNELFISENSPGGLVKFQLR